MRDRLIELLKNSPHLNVLYGDDKEWEEAADHLLAAGCILPPCEAGDTVYYLDGAEVVKDKVIGVLYSDDRDYLTKSVRTYDCLLAWENFGKTYFATKEEAERALAERRGG